jgi:acid phosphatase
VQGDLWLKRNLDAYAHWAKKNNSLLIITWDEDDGSENNHIPIIFIGPMVSPGKYNTYMNHYTLLRTIAEMYDFPPIGQSAEALPIRVIWKSVK